MMTMLNLIDDSTKLAEQLLSQPHDKEFPDPVGSQSPKADLAAALENLMDWKFALVKDALLTLGAHPIEESNFPTDYRELQNLLARRLDPCDAVIHLVGFHYGGEPNKTPDIPRRSWTQWEYYRAVEAEHPKPVYRFVAGENRAFDAQLEEDQKKQRLQREHWERLRKPGGSIYYEFSTTRELRERILGIDELRELVQP